MRFCLIVIFFLPIQILASEQVLVFAEDHGSVVIYNVNSGIYQTVTTAVDDIVGGTLQFIDDSTIVFAYVTPPWAEAIHTQTGQKMICPGPNCDEDILNLISASNDYDHYSYFREDYYAFNIHDTTDYWLCGTKLYELKNGRTQKITATLFNREGIKLSADESTCYCEHGTEYQGGRFKCMRKEEIFEEYRFYAESNTVNGYMVYSKNGDLFLKSATDTVLILDFTGEWDFKFGNGYYQPCLSSTGNQLVFRYSTAFYDEWGAGKHAVLLYDLRTKKLRTLVEENCASPTFSGDDMYLLMSRIQRQMGVGWVATILLYSFETNDYLELGPGSHFAWSN